MAIKKFNTETRVWEYITPTKAEFDAHAGKVATTVELGHVMVDGVTITIDSNGRISAVGGGQGGEGAPVVDATTLVKGVVKLANDIDLDVDTLAATPKAVKDALAAAKTFTEEQVAALVDSAPDTLNTLRELAEAIQEGDTALEGLISAIAGKATKEEFDAHVLAFNTHAADADKHITVQEREAWNAGSKIHVGSEAPADQDKLWISPIV